MLLSSERLDGMKVVELRVKMNVNRYIDLPDISMLLNAQLSPSGEGNDNVTTLINYAEDTDIALGTCLPINQHSGSWETTACLELVERGASTFARLYAPKDFNLYPGLKLCRTIQSIEDNSTLIRKEIAEVVELVE